MKRFPFAAAATALAVLATNLAPAGAQDAPASAGGVIPRAQVEQLVATLKQRNDQVRDMAERMREMEARLAQADDAIRLRDNGAKALQVAAQKNRELAAIGEAIIADYEKRDLGKRIGTGEPLTQLYRVRLQNKLQEFQDQIAAQGFYPERELETIEAASAVQAAPPPIANP